MMNHNETGEGHANEPRKVVSRHVMVDIDDLTYDKINPPSRDDVLPQQNLLHDLMERTSGTFHSEEDGMPAPVEGNGIDRSQESSSSSMFQSDDGLQGPRVFALVGFRPLSALGLSFMVSLLLGIVVFLCLLMAVLVIDKLGVLNMVNALMGAAAHFTTGRMIELSVVLAVIYVVGATMVRFLKMMMVNATGKIIGPVKITLDSPSTRMKNGEE